MVAAKKRAKLDNWNAKPEKNNNVFSRVKECTLLQCFPYRCVGICRLSYFDSVRDYLLSGISINEMPIPDSCLRFMVSRVKMICSRFTAE